MAYIIGIGGGSGAGKTYLASILKELFKGHITILPYDHYCLDQSHLPMEERAKVNFDHPDAYDYQLYAKHIKMLKEDKSINRPNYDMATHSRTKETTLTRPSEIIVLEGLLFFPHEEVFNQLDLSIFVDAKEETRLTRRIARDTKERGRSEQSVRTQFFNFVKPMHEIYVEPFRKKVDIVFNNEGFNGLDPIILDRLVKKIEKESHVEMSNL